MWNTMESISRSMASTCSDDCSKPAYLVGKGFSSSACVFAISGHHDRHLSHVLINKPEVTASQRVLCYVA